MTLQDQLLSIERELWTNGADVYERNLLPDAVLVFGETGAISKGEAIDAIRKENKDGRRWAEVEFDEVRTLELGADAALLTYQVRARWAHEAASMRALASSAYVRREAEWKLAFHQQTPVENADSQRHTSIRRKKTHGSVSVQPAGAAGALSAGAVALGACAVGATAIGAMAIGALAIGRLGIGRFDIKRGRVRSLKIAELEIDRLVVRQR